MIKYPEMRIDLLTLFPTMFFGPLQESILKRAQQQGLLDIRVHQIRDYAMDRHQMTDDLPYGGGHGMVMKPEPIFHAVRSVMGSTPSPVILLTPQGSRLTQQRVTELAQQSRLALICGHYEGVDERVRRHLVTEEISIGDYVLTGGELSAMVLIDAVARFVPGVLGAETGAQQDSFATGWLEGPQYTRPASYEGWDVPDVLLSGHHAAIARWKRMMALRRTLERRPDLLDRSELSEDDQRALAQFPEDSGEPDETD